MGESSETGQNNPELQQLEEARAALSALPPLETIDQKIKAAREQIAAAKANLIEDVRAALSALPSLEMIDQQIEAAREQIAAAKANLENPNGHYVFDIDFGRAAGIGDLHESRNTVAETRKKEEALLKALGLSQS